jgi:hypothetical protein
VSDKYADKRHGQSKEDALWGTVFAVRNTIFGPVGAGPGKGLVGKVKRLGESIQANQRSISKMKERQDRMERRLSLLEAGRDKANG